jgi:Arc/MetJ-type ribon-helix-helix transcriptional regulator
MATTARFTRQKISTTISPQTLEFLEQLVKSGEAHTMAEALDLAIARLLTFENRERLASDTDAYYANMTDAETTEERRLEAALAQTSQGIDFEQ